MDLKDIKAIIDLMRKNSISEFELEKQDFKIRLKRGVNGGNLSSSGEDQPVAVMPSVPMAISPVPLSLGVGNPSPTSDLEVKAPMVGTFYRSPSPESAAYVEIGSELNPETIVCIIEAMKVMNEIKAEVRGVVTQVLIENGKPVEFGQPLFKYRPL
ncbi:MAG TPA: acetyl-CoA carboxylase biotin carboxyl carrier protein [Candidatus Paceibacterota bacterium]|nr:acetyl-CoA carboxylase biotin carboxyl carrier protein [Candidatus Paceibacterota bacterium]